MTAWLRDEAGVRVPVTREGIVVGRDPRCHVILEDASVSRRHALLLPTTGGVQVMALGAGVVTLDGEALEEAAVAGDGAVVGVGTDRFTVHVEAAPPTTTPWVVELEGRSYAIQHPAFRIGGGSGDDLYLADWPAGALTLQSVEGGLVVEAEVPTTIAGRPAPPGMQSLRSGDAIRLGDVRLKVVARDEEPETTIREHTAGLPQTVTLEFERNGGILRLATSQITTVWLPEKRCDLCAALLQPSDELDAGDFIPDDALIAKVWGAAGASRMQLNTLVHRLRRSLTDAGLNGARLIERARGGGATRFSLAPRAEVSVR